MKLTMSLIVFGVVMFALIGIFGKNNEEMQQEALASAKVRGNLISDILKEVDEGEAEILDVRTKVEYDLGHMIPASLFNVEWLKSGELPEIAKDTKLYVYCHSGSRSAVAKEILNKNGYEDVVDLGGLYEWEEVGGETVKTDLPDYLDILTDIEAEPLPALGNEDAEVTMTKYHDYMCPFCAKFTTDTEPQLLEKYVNTGKVKYLFRNVAFQGDESAYAAIGGYCANEQGKFWDFQSQVAVKYQEVGEDLFDIEPLSEFASSIGMNKADYSYCMSSGKYDDVVTSETLDAQSRGVEGTPFFQVGETFVNGARTLETFEAAIDAQL